MKVGYSYLKDQFSDPQPILDAFKAQLGRCDFTFGPELEEFEKKMAGYINVPYCLGTSSGTMALIMMLQSAGVGWGDEVITVSQTFVATIGAIVAVGARPVFIDVLDDFTMNPALIEEMITPRTRAIMPVHYSGCPAHMHEILAVAEKHNLPVLEDSCCAISGRLDGKHVGTFGASGAFSVHPLKNLNVWGDGGLVVTNSKKTYDDFFLLRNHGLSGRDEVHVFGWNGRLDTIQAIVGNYLFPQIDDITDKRIANAQKYDKALSDPSFKGIITLPPRRSNARHVYHMYMFLADKRDALLAHLQKKEIEAKIHYPIPMHRQKAVLDQKTPFRCGNLSKTDAQCKSLITLPVHQHLSSDQTDFVIEQIRAFYRK